MVNSWLDKYADRIEVLSPGLPPAPITLEKIELLNYMPCSRNPNLARGLSFFERIEEQGDGLRRIVNTTQGIGLPRPEFRFRDGHFMVIFKGPGDNILKLKSQAARPIFEVEKIAVDTLTPTQKALLRILLEVPEAKTMAMARDLGLSRPAIQKALAQLKLKGLVRQSGRTRDASYTLVENAPGR